MMHLRRLYLISFVLESRSLCYLSTAECFVLLSIIINVNLIVQLSELHFYRFVP